MPGTSFEMKPPVFVCDACKRNVDYVRGSMWHGVNRICRECFSQWYDPDNGSFDSNNPVSLGNYVRHKHGLPPLEVSDPMMRSHTATSESNRPMTDKKELEPCPFTIGWQPIETAPQDGTHILVGTFPASPGHITVATAHWFGPVMQRAGFEPAGWALSVNYNGEHSGHGVESPTHWLPLPAPPRAHPEQP